MVRIALRPRNLYLEKNAANGMARTIEHSALTDACMTVKPRSFHV